METLKKKLSRGDMQEPNETKIMNETKILLVSSHQQLQKSLDRQKNLSRRLNSDKTQVHSSLRHAQSCLERVMRLHEEALRMRVSLLALSLDYSTLDKRLAPIEREARVLAQGIGDLQQDKENEAYLDKTIETLGSFGDNMIRDVYCVGTCADTMVTLEQRRQASKLNPDGTVQSTTSRQGATGATQDTEQRGTQATDHQETQQSIGLGFYDSGGSDRHSISVLHNTSHAMLVTLN